MISLFERYSSYCFFHFILNYFKVTFCCTSSYYTGAWKQIMDLGGGCGGEGAGSNRDLFCSISTNVV